MNLAKMMPMMTRVENVLENQAIEVALVDVVNIIDMIGKAEKVLVVEVEIRLVVVVIDERNGKNITAAVVTLPVTTMTTMMTVVLAVIIAVKAKSDKNHPSKREKL